jgi:hypothetical protein
MKCETHNLDIEEFPSAIPHAFGYVFNINPNNIPECKSCRILKLLDLQNNFEIIVRASHGLIIIKPDLHVPVASIYAINS